jgi:molybdenum cofactor biosynthesis protein B
MGLPEHRRAAVAAVRCAVVTVSDTRVEATDASGRAVVELLEQAGHVVESKAIVRDEVEEVRTIVGAHLGRVDAVITTGGTGIASRDTTCDALDPLFERRIDGFGELFRALSYEEIGSAAMLSRATAGIACGTVVFVLPGSENAVRLAMTKLILPELGHLVHELRK